MKKKRSLAGYVGRVVDGTNLVGWLMEESYRADKEDNLVSFLVGTETGGRPWVAV